MRSLAVREGKQARQKLSPGISRRMCPGWYKSVAGYSTIRISRQIRVLTDASRRYTTEDREVISRDIHREHRSVSSRDLKESLVNDPSVGALVSSLRKKTTSIFLAIAGKILTH